MRKTIDILISAVPVLIMVLLIPFIANDYILTLVYVIIISFALFLKHTKNEIIIFFFGFLAMTIFEYILVSTGTETFVRNSLGGLMPLWLPFLWGYGFIAIKRGVEILEKEQNK